MADVIPMRRDAEPASVPPFDAIAEATVLADILLGGSEHFGRVRDFLRAEHFYSEAHRQIFAAMSIAAESSEPIDTTTVLTRLKQAGRVEQVGGSAYIVELLNSTAAVNNVVPHARIVHDRWRERQAIATAQRIAAQGYLGVTDTQAYLDGAVRSLGSIARASVVAKGESNVEAIKRILRAASERSEAKTKVPLGIATGLAEYDDEWGGLHGGEVTTFVARPKVGKTSLALQLLATVTRQRLGVLMFSQDSPRDDLLTDLLSHEAKVDSKAFRKGDLSVAEWERITSAASALGTRTFWIDDTRSIHVGQVRARALATADDALRQERVPLGLIIVDYIQQLAAAPGFEHRKKHEYIGHAANEIKTLARTLKIPIVVLAQQKRDDRGEPVYEAADCSEIEKECDNLFFIEKTSPRTRKLRCALVRRGAQRSIDLSFDGPSRTFSEAKLEADSRRFVDHGPSVDPRLPPEADE